MTNADYTDVYIETNNGSGTGILYNFNIKGILYNFNIKGIVYNC